MDADKLPPPADGRSPAELTKKELTAHLVTNAGVARWKLNVMPREAIVALFDLTQADALAAIDAAGKAHGRKQRQRTGQDETAVFAREQATAVAYEHVIGGRVQR